MWRLIHVVVIGALVGSAVYAYSIKYETILFAEKIMKVKHRIALTHDAIAMLRADWAHLTRPERLQALVMANLDTQSLALAQIGQARDIPQRGTKIDTIGRTLDTLVTSSIATPSHTPNHTPRAPRTAGGATPHAR